MGKYSMALISTLILAVFLSGCVEQPEQQTTTTTTAQTPKEKAKAACMQKCLDALSAGQNLSNGPCLDNKIAEGWVCDVAHSPRQAMDNEKANQCSEYGITANSFVEVDPSCNFIRAYP
jgi:hypothetical protein